MCGFGGILNSSLKVSFDTLAQIAKSVSHRGPDSTGFAFFNETFDATQQDASHAFFFNRLSIIDLDARSNQPFQNEQYLLLFNGEIYNYLQIRDELKKLGILFKTSSDTEVLFYSLQVWGADALLKLNGMFAFFWMNKADQSFLFARDRTGIKPIYYRIEDKSLIFASELNTVVRLSNKKLKISSNSINDYLYLQYIPTPYSILEDISKLEPGHFISGSIHDLNAKKVMRSTPYWNAYTVLSSIEKSESTCDLEHLLVESIRGQLIADVPLGLFLSSGVDSSLLTAIINKHFKDIPYNFFTVAFDRQTDSDESYQASKFLSGFNNSNLNHHKLTISPDFIRSRLEQVYDFFDEPFGDSAALLNWAISAKAREHVTVVLSGDGADELFWGYPRYTQWQAQIKRLANGMFPTRLLKNTINILPGSRTKISLQNSIERDPLKAYFSLVSPRMFGHYMPDSNSRKYWFSEGLDQLIQRSDLPSVLDFKTYLPDAMLYKVDRSSMASSLEVRVPYLDNKIIDYALQLPLAKKSNTQFGNKAPLKELLNRLAPHYDINSPKRGFNFPLEYWLKHEWRELVMDNITKANLDDLSLSSSYFLKLTEKFYKKETKLVMEVWHLLNLILWHRKFKSEHNQLNS